MIGWDIFDFSSETAVRDSKQICSTDVRDQKVRKRNLTGSNDLNIFYQVVFFSLMSK